MEIAGFQIGTAFFATAIGIIAIWVLIEIKRLKHKVFAIFLVLLVLSFYLTATYSLKGQEIDFKTVPGLVQAGKVYFSWLTSIYGNVRGITSNAVKMDWTASNATAGG